MSDLETSADIAPSNNENTAVPTETTTEVQPAASWTDSLPDDLKTNASLSKFKDSNSVLKSYLELEKSMGSKVKVPGSDATDEERNAFFNKMGRPETKDGYEFNKVLEGKEGLLEVAPGLKESMEKFSELAHTLGIPKDTAQKLMGWQTEKLEAQIEAMAAKTAAGKETLTKVWGDQFDTKNAEAEQVVKILGKEYPDEMQEFITSDAARNPISKIMLAELATLYKEKSNGVLEGAAPTVLNKQEQIQAIMHAGREHPVWNDRHPDHAKAVADYNALYLP